MKKVRYAPEAEADIYAAARYIAEDAGSLAPAFRFIETMAEKAELLATQPAMGRERPELSPGLRSFPVGAFILFYRATRAGIEIARVIRGGRDITALF